MSIDGTKKSRGRPRVDSVAQHFRIPIDLASRIDAWAELQPDRPLRAEAIRQLVERGLASDNADTLTRLSDAALNDHIAQREVAIAEMPEYKEPSPEAALATMDGALAKNELVKLKNRRTRRKIAKAK